MAQILTSGFAGHTSSGTIALSLSYKTVSDKTHMRECGCVPHVLLTKTNVWNHWSSLPAFWKIFFISVHVYVWVYTHPYGCPWKPGASGASSWLQAMWARLTGTGTKVWNSVKVAGVFNTETTLRPPYSCLSMSTAVWFLDRRMCYTQPKSRMQNTDEFVPRESHSSPQHWDTCQWVKGLGVREKTQSRRERWGQSWYVVNTGSQAKKT